MAKTAKTSNPFYVLLVLIGVAFLISACAYGVMAYGAVWGVERDGGSGSGLMRFMDEHGAILLGVELLLLGAFTVGAIGTDEFWQRRAARDGRKNNHEHVELIGEGHESDAHH